MVKRIRKLIKPLNPNKFDKSSNKKLNFLIVFNNSSEDIRKDLKKIDGVTIRSVSSNMASVEATYEGLHSLDNLRSVSSIEHSKFS